VEVGRGRVARRQAERVRRGAVAGRSPAAVARDRLAGRLVVVDRPEEDRLDLPGEVVEVEVARQVCAGASGGTSSARGPRVARGLRGDGSVLDPVEDLRALRLADGDGAVAVRGLEIEHGLVRDLGVAEGRDRGEVRLHLRAAHGRRSREGETADACRGAVARDIRAPGAPRRIEDRLDGGLEHPVGIERGRGVDGSVRRPPGRRARRRGRLGSCAASRVVAGRGWRVARHRARRAAAAGRCEGDRPARRQPPRRRRERATRVASAESTHSIRSVSGIARIHRGGPSATAVPPAAASGGGRHPRDSAAFLDSGASDRIRSDAFGRTDDRHGPIARSSDRSSAARSLRSSARRYDGVRGPRIPRVHAVRSDNCIAWSAARVARVLDPIPAG
jgi:hypothetical protein